jgi:hypothetical protein
MSENQRRGLIAAVAVVAIIAVVALGVAVFQPGGSPFETEFGALGVRWGRVGNLRVDHHLRVDEDAVISGPTALPTGTPALVVDNAGVGAAFEVRDAGTPVWAVNDGGSVSQTGDQAVTGDLTLTGDLSVTGSGAIAQATAATTATPAVVIDSSAAGAKLLDVRDAATPVFSINNGGSWTSTGAGTHSSGQTINNWAVVAAPTALPTGTPAVDIANAGVGAILNVSGSALEYQFDTSALDVQGNYIEADLNTEHLMLPSVITATVAYTPASGTVATLGAGEIWFIHAVYANVKTNFDCTGNDCDVQIGDDLDTDGFLDLDDAELQTTDTEGTGAEAGWQGFMSTDTSGAYMSNGLGFVYAAAAGQTIDYAVAGTDPAAGLLDVYVVYTRVK